MSNRLSTEKQNLSGFRFRFPPAGGQLLVGIFAAVLSYLAILGENPGAVLTLFLMALFVVGMWSKRAWLLWLMIGAIVYLKYFAIEPRVQFGYRGLRFADVFAAPVMILLLASCFRYLELARYMNTFFPHIKRGQKSDAGIRFQFPSLLGGRWWAIPLAVFLAMVLLEAFPFERSPFLAQFRIRPAASRLVFLTLFLFFAWFIGNSIVGILIRWKTKPDQADVHCRSLIAKELWKETYNFERRKLKLKSKDTE